MQWNRRIVLFVVLLGVVKDIHDVEVNGRIERGHQDGVWDTLSETQRIAMMPVEWVKEVGEGERGQHDEMTFSMGAENGPKRYAGYFKLNRTYDAHMFFFYFEARENPENAPVVLWMTGGPGCSSELAVFYENGPWKIREDLSVEETKYGWDSSAHMIYVDQPINTGFSWSEDDRDRCYDEGMVVVIFVCLCV